MPLNRFHTTSRTGILPVVAKSLCGALLVLGMSVNCSAQLDTQWVKYYGGPRYDAVMDHIQMSDGGYVFVGTTRLDTLRNEILWVVRLNSEGDEIWTQTLTPVYRCGGWEVVECPNGNLAIFGINFIDRRGGVSRDILCASLSSDGDSLWMKTYGGDQNDVGLSGLTLDNGNLIIGGYTDSFGNGGHDTFLLCLNEEGDSLWMKTYGGRGEEDCNEVLQTLDRGFALVGTKYAQLNAPQAFLVVFTDSEGDSIWSFTTTFDDQATSIAHTMQQIRESLFVVSGFAGGSIDLINTHLWVVAFDRSGRQLWDILDGLDGQGYGKGALSSCKINSDVIALTGGYFERNGYASSSGGFWVQEITHDGWLGEDGFWESDSPNVCNSIIFNRDGCYSVAGNTYDGLNIDARNQEGFLLLTTPSNNRVNNESRHPQPNNYSITAFPNPFNSFVTIQYALPIPGFAKITVEDIAGRQVAMLGSGHPPFNSPPASKRGKQPLVWNASGYPAGSYFVRLESGGTVRTERVILVK